MLGTGLVAVFQLLPPVLVDMLRLFLKYRDIVRGLSIRTAGGVGTQKLRLRLLDF
jgi:hypothetical protein